MIFFSVFRNSQTAKRRDKISATGCATHAEQRTYRHDTMPIQRQISCNNQNDKKSRVNTNIYSI